LESSSSAFHEASEVLSARASFKHFDFIIVRRNLTKPPSNLWFRACFFVSLFDWQHFDTFIHDKHLSVGAKALLIVHITFPCNPTFFRFFTPCLLFLTISELLIG
jgi:hypothetical protein